MKKEDLRVKKTKLSLYNGLLSLMTKKPFESIKISEICNVSLVNRSTFYDHFNDKYELFQSYIEHLSVSLSEKLNVKVETSNINEYYLEFLKLLLDELSENFTVYKAFLNNNLISVARDMIEEVAVKNITKHVIENYDFPDIEMAKTGVQFYVDGTIGICTEEVKNSSSLNKEKLIEFFSSVVPNFNKEKK